ncbi:hypothetical protein Cni_G10953 [Canna indica]|uniref:Uncharacterized protein n=1 Tax=Canna indica TaxID=4628 RepID=A0AAQ3Q922_9LILI|nr:hypothetical protein Cni_G10953 [Canna indica]
MEQPLVTVSITPSSPVQVVPTPAATPPAPAKPSNPNILVALLLFLAVAAISLWANYEASKGFDIVVANAAPRTAAGSRFALLFVDNGRAARLVLAASGSVERALYPDDSFAKKPVQRVTLLLAGDDVGLIREESAGGAVVAVGPGRREGEFVVRLSPAVMAAADVRAAVAAAVRRGMARVWLRDGQGKAPRSVLDALAEYLATPADSAVLGRPNWAIAHLQGNASVILRPNGSCWEDSNDAASFFRYCDKKQQGFVARLNKAMEDEWREQMLDEALMGSSSALVVCSTYRSISHVVQ